MMRAFEEFFLLGVGPVVDAKLPPRITCVQIVRVSCHRGPSQYRAIVVRRSKRCLCSALVGKTENDCARITHATFRAAR
ncbi:MAG: hypothetical protein WBW73_10815, partial [Rhodoplanes sp.]